MCRKFQTSEISLKHIRTDKVQEKKMVIEARHGITLTFDLFRLTHTQKENML